MNLENKKILITGATGGIGNSLVEKFNNLGSQIIATGTNEEKLSNLKKKYQKIIVEKFKLNEHDKIENTKFKEPKFKIINNVNANAETDPENIKSLLVEQIFSTVRWRESILKMNNAGVKKYIEIGPGKVLSGMVKRTLKDVNSFSINSIADIKNFENEFRK